MEGQGSLRKAKNLVISYDKPPLSLTLLIYLTIETRPILPIMSAPKLHLFLASRQASCHVPRPVQCLRQAACFRRDIHRSQYFAEEIKPFRAQLYESTARRLAREREDQRRFAEAIARDTSPVGRTLAITFGWSLVSLKSSTTDSE